MAAFIVAGAVGRLRPSLAGSSGKAGKGKAGERRSPCGTRLFGDVLRLDLNQELLCFPETLKITSAEAG